MSRMFWQLCQAILGPVFRNRAHLQAENTELLDSLSNPTIIIANHVSYLDPVVIGLLIPADAHTMPIRFLTKKEIFKPFMAPILSMAGAIRLDTEKPLKALKTALSVLKAGDCIGIFPEGVRSRTGNLLEFKEGVEFLAKKSGAIVLPVVIIGAYRPGVGFVSGISKFVAFMLGRYEIRVIFGQPLCGNIEESYKAFYYSRTRGSHSASETCGVAVDVV